MYEELNKLRTLYDRGVITYDEFLILEKDLTAKPSSSLKVSIAEQKTKRASSNLLLKILTGTNSLMLLIGFVLFSPLLFNDSNTAGNSVENISYSDDLFSQPSDLKSVVKEVSESVFNIVCETKEGIATGSGWAIMLDNEGGQEVPHIITNHHVIEMCLIDGYSGKLYATNESYEKLELTVYNAEGGFWEFQEEESGSSLRDIALLGFVNMSEAVEVKGLHLQKEPVELSQWALIVGYPAETNELLVYSTTLGVISGISDLGLVLTDAAVNNGNSGGPMINSRGEVIATVFAANPSSEYESMGFAQPIEFHCTIAFECLDGGILFGKNGNPSIYTPLEPGDCLAYSILNEYNLYDASCNESADYIITEELIINDETNLNSLPDCVEDGVIEEYINQKARFYCYTEFQT